MEFAGTFCLLISLDKAIPLILVSKKENISIVEELIEENKGWNLFYFLYLFSLLVFTV